MAVYYISVDNATSSVQAKFGVSLIPVEFPHELKYPKGRNHSAQGCEELPWVIRPPKPSNPERLGLIPDITLIEFDFIALAWPKFRGICQRLAPEVNVRG
jgi:hypothetical protein